MGTASPKSKSERLEARITPEQKDLFSRAARLSGRSLTDFVISTVQAAAEETIRQQRVLELTARSTEAFLNALENPLPPNELLRKATRRYRSLAGE